MKTIAVLTSGGDAPGMNAAIRAVIRYGIHKGCKVYGISRGYKGLIEGDLAEVDLRSACDIIHRGGTILRTARCEEFMTEEGRRQAATVLRVFGVDGLVVIGGDGTFKGARELAKLGVNVVGIPGTIDNDLPYTDYTIGFDTAINTVLDAIGKIRDTSSSHERISIIEVMGRNCGDIALYAGLAGGAEEVVIPEKGQDMEKIFRELLESKSRGKKQSIIILSEGVGEAHELEKQIKEKTKMDSRSTVLGHIQRGGSPSAFDRILATKMGATAVELLIQGKTARVIGIRNNMIFDMDVEEALGVIKKFDSETYELIDILAN
ncbi:6-phosphofructokinase PfkA [Peptoclostridium acidaminophilum DSM 3953]|uniref:ATP-dependent 6-phosphofructokinase n=1 Tax=Peptoclostridium acidaminophilum DSM 3953 TaxID=1286171 RepID=W8TD73_PEPAC|nr:6-phosphofructokinase [Peptoclostridium acidaminophilum]AHM55758.1 6-phosphofructokinase PfkA [Peptoclostridium acidaminophilum DSM 3953]